MTIIHKSCMFDKLNFQTPIIPFDNIILISSYYLNFAQTNRYKRSSILFHDKEYKVKLKFLF